MDFPFSDPEWDRVIGGSLVDSPFEDASDKTVGKVALPSGCGFIVHPGYEERWRGQEGLTV